jgi:UDP-N-acetyl-D-glucosamine dehydrogenase
VRDGKGAGPVAESLEEQLLRRIAERSARVAVMGLGYVGLPLALLLAEGGFAVTGYDINAGYVERLRQGRSGVVDVPDARLQAALDAGSLLPTADPADLAAADAFLISVPTPLSKTRQPDLSCIEEALRTLLRVWGPGKLVVLESTTYPGTTDELLLPALRQGGTWELDRDFLLAFSPERVDPGNSQYPLSSIPKVVGGVSPASGRVAAALYATVFERVHPVSGARTAELTKLLENTFRNVNIALINEFAQICDTLGVDVWEVVEAAKTKPFGFMAFYPGPGIGGHCIPLDPQYLVYRARLSGYEPRLVALADQINQGMPAYVARKAMDMLNARGLPMRGAQILAVGVTYKPDIPDLRESPALPVIREIRRLGGEVRYVDPYVPELTLDGVPVERVDLTAETLATTDLAIVLTAHRALDLDPLKAHSEKVLDTRHAATLNSSPRVTA